MYGILKYYDAGLDPNEVAALNSSANVLSSDTAMIAQSSLNRATRNFDQQMYNQEHANAIADWNMQNTYNSPSAQMARLQAAGLNPNLVYGSGTDAGGVSSPVQEKTYQSWNPTSPQGAIMGIGNALQGYTDTQMKLAQLDNIKATNAQIVQETALKAAETVQAQKQAGLTGVETDQAQFDLSLKSDLRDISMQTQQATLNKLQADTTYTLDQNARSALSNQLELRKGNVSIQEALVTIAQKQAETRKINAETTNVKTDTDLKNSEIIHTDTDSNRIVQQIKNLQTSQYLDKLDAGLKQNGIQPGDAGWYRWIEVLMGQLTKGIKGRSDQLPLHPNVQDQP